MKCLEKANLWMEMGVIANGHEVFVWSDDNILKLGCGDGCITLRVY